MKTILEIEGIVPKKNINQSESTLIATFIQEPGVTQTVTLKIGYYEVEVSRGHIEDIAGMFEYIAMGIPDNVSNSNTLDDL